MPMVEILKKASVQAHMVTAIWVIIMSSTARGTCEDVLLNGLVRTTLGIKQ
jgi:hypothetical protein